MSHLIWIYTVCTGIGFGLPSGKGNLLTHVSDLIPSSDRKDKQKMSHVMRKRLFELLIKSVSMPDP